MSTLVERYLKDYSRNYLVIGGVPTSPFGVTLAKRCKWCYCVMTPNTRQTKKGNEDYIDMEGKTGIMHQAFCSKDCKEDYEDWSYFRRLKYNRERTLRLYHQSHPVRRQRRKVPLDRKEYLKQYHLQHKEKRQQQFKEQRLRRLSLTN